MHAIVEAPMQASFNGGRRLANVAPAPAYKSPGSIVHGLLRRWPYLVLCLVASGAAAYFTSEHFGKETWTLNTAIMCNPGDVQTSGGLDIVTMQHMFKTRPALQKVIDDQGLNCEPRYLEKALDVTVPHQGNSIVLAIRWSDREEGERILDALVKQAIVQADSTQHAYFEKIRVSSEENLIRSKEALQTAQANLTEFNNKADVLDVDQDLLNSRDSIEVLEGSLREQRTAQTDALTQRTRGAGLALAMTTNRMQIEQLQNDIAARRKEFERIKALRHEMQPLTADVAMALSAREKAEAEMHEVSKALASNRSAISVLHPAHLATEPVVSNKKKILGGVFVLSTLVLCAPLLLLELRSLREHHVAALARRLGLPLLASVDSLAKAGGRRELNSAMLNEEFARLLALRLQQYAHVPGSVICFSSINEGPTPPAMLAHLAECLAHRDQRVLIISLEDDVATERSLGRYLQETKVEETGVTANYGLADHLAVDNGNVDLLPRRTSVPSIDYMLAGSQPMPREGLGTRRMSALVDQLRERYTLILIAGPSISQPVDLELLAARVDGVVFHSFGATPCVPHTAQELHHLAEMGAPVLGLIG